ncbi:hypothetical protein DRO60_02915 [Candidatus Bathyarchaeota archaeon]|nr:MAG: hypothetical protein DRO60_02915 [Candidatus Bathyarchaeota archaeon]
MAREELHAKMDRLVEKYSELLFTLPSKGRLFALVLSASLIPGACYLISLALAKASLWLACLPLLVPPLTTLAAWALDMLLLRPDPLLNARRCLGLELFSLLSLVPLASAGAFLGPELAVRLTAIGASIAISARSLVMVAASLASTPRRAACTITCPLAWTLAAYALASLWQPSRLPSLLPLAFLAIGCLAAGSLLAYIRHVGERVLGSNPFRPLRGFAASWMEDLSGPLEEFLTEVGAKADITTHVLVFRERGTGRPLGALVVPGIHPGPFRDVGSSPLPGLLQEALEARLGCPVAVAHGTSGHDLNLTARSEREKLIEAVCSALDGLRGPYREATRLVRARGERAEAACQLLGPLALVVLTASPETMEDLPPEVGELTAKRARELGLADAIVVDAHNSLNGPFDRTRLVERFTAAASEALGRARELPRSQLRFGMARVVPAEFTLEDGMGPGGISVLALEAGDQKMAYVVVDGNNMVSGLREHLLEALRGLGFDEGEVMTSDTHVVNARLLVERGYHPVGEAMDWRVLADYVRGAAQAALRAMRPAEAWHARVVAKGLRVFGAEQLDRLCGLPMAVLRATKRGVLGLLTPAHAALMALALLI